MKNKLELYLLDGCDRCNRIKYMILAEELEYEAVNCTSSTNNICDKLEDKVDCGRYPMAVIKKKGSTTIVHFCDGQSASGTTTKKVPVNSEDKFVEEIKKAYI